MIFILYLLQNLLLGEVLVQVDLAVLSLVINSHQKTLHSTCRKHTKWFCSCALYGTLKYNYKLYYNNVKYNPLNAKPVISNYSFENQKKKTWLPRSKSSLGV